MTEFKREYVEDIKNTVIAFANCDGGIIYIGINDDGSIQGVADGDAAMLRVTNAIRDAIKPDVTMFTECHFETMDEKTVIIVTVQRGTARPYYLGGKGIRPEGVYIRQGAATVPATETAILRMIRETSGDSYEEARSINQQLTFDSADSYFKSHNVEFGAAQKRTLGLISEDGTYSNLAFLLSDQCGQMIKLAVFEGGKKTVFKDRRELSGSLLRQLEDAYDYINRYNRTRAEFSGLNRIDRRDYPTEAIREALLNAIVHRDYSFSSPTLISLFDDRIEFVTIGGLVRGVTLDDIKLGVSVLRNPRLANVFYRLKLIEAYGTGIMKINECYNSEELEPEIETSDNAFKINLPNLNYRTSKTDTPQKSVSKGGAVSAEDRESVIMTMLEKQDAITRKDVQDALGVSQSTAILLLRELTGRGVLVKERIGRNLRYRRG